MQHTTVALADRSNVIDIPTIVHTAIALPQQVASLERAMIVCAIVLAAVGIVNAALLVALLRTRARIVASVATPAVTDSNAAASGAVKSRAARGTACACGRPISRRSKSGRCRSCALDARTQ